jgi:FlaG/FlaF family flagellin (archaellin)
MALRPWLDERSSHGPKHGVSHVGQILLIAVAVALAGFLAALITGILTAGGS